MFPQWLFGNNLHRRTQNWIGNLTYFLKICSGFVVLVIRCQSFPLTSVVPSGASWIWAQINYTGYNQSVTCCGSQRRQCSCNSTKTYVNSMILILKLNLTSLRNATYVSFRLIVPSELYQMTYRGTNVWKWYESLLIKGKTRAYINVGKIKRVLTCNVMSNLRNVWPRS